MRRLTSVVNLSLENCIASSVRRRIAMFSSRDAFENDFCPVRDELLGEMYRASEHGLPKLVESVSSEVRAMLALFCYRRSHLHALAVAIAASCNERELILFGGRVGSALYALSREAPAARPVIGIPRPPQSRSRFRPSRSARFRQSRMNSTTNSPRPSRRKRSRQRRQSVPPPRHRAFGIAGHAGPADLGPHRIDPASRRDPDPGPTAPSSGRRRSACPTVCR